jgi:CMP-N-acetylneuraminic acid synthetase
VDRVVLSSDDEEIMEVARTWGCEVPFKRPAEFATDQASSMDVVRHALAALPGYEHVALLQPTSPLRTGADIDAAFDLMQSRQAPSCVSVSEVEQSPYWMYRVGDNDQLVGLISPPEGVSRRQDLPVVHALNGAIYLARVDWLLAQGSFVGEGTVGYQMPRDRSIDIDTADDFQAFRRQVEDAAITGASPHGSSQSLSN